MADCNTNTVVSGPGNVNFLNNNYFKFELSRLPNFTYFVQNANIPSLTARYANQPSNLGVFPKIPAGNYIFDPLEVSFNVAANMQNWIDIYNWMKGIGNLKDDLTQLPHHKFDNTGVFSDASLLIMNSSYVPISKVVFKYVFPLSLGAMSFTTQNTSTDPMSTTVQFAYSYYELVAAGSTGPSTQ
jgi:hypothetical protein